MSRRHVGRSLAAPLLMIGSAGWAATPALDGPTLMETVAGRIYRRTVHAAGGDLLEVSQLRIGVLQYLKDGRVAVRVEMTSRPPGGDWSPISRFRWICEADAADMLMNVFALVERRTEMSAPRDGWRLTVDGPAVRYPKAVTPGMELDDVVLRLRAGQGVASLFGKRIVARVVRRHVHAIDGLDGGSYTLNSDVEAAAYWLGVPVRRWRLQSTEALQPDRGLVRLRVTFEDGGFAVVETLRDGRPGELTQKARETAR